MVDASKEEEGAEQMRVEYLIIGNGYLGNRMLETFPDSKMSTKHINSERDALEEIWAHDPKVVINCAGKTGRPNVDWCEDNKLETYKGNVLLPINLALACKSLDKKFVHISSGCIYNGYKEGGFSEEDEPNFCFHTPVHSYYSGTKALAEENLSAIDPDILQLRIRMPLDDRRDKFGRDLLTKMLGYAERGNLILSVPNSITYIPYFLSISKKLIDDQEEGIVNVVNEGAITHDEILQAYQKASGKELNYTLLADPNLLKTKAPRSNCILSVALLEQMLGHKARTVQDAVEEAARIYSRREAREERA